ncbi:uncharacterized protein F5891DRAFT_1211213 [Suillus fuscotomentosus]|uniref:PIN domain-containing protein n=1 Tax=Suillus fuscotomentosus TaxID=1912939 RepID=A0AAD4DRQ3_9AGAM|nr:uncharacterized protein F5891DRAFT_1211213 [Suillus fuscotomentosus]KAG1891639.1 hypothetical protein F5891DRAFT_1211213 [Suillus fuscotomentosus]
MWFCFRAHTWLSVQRRAHGSRRKVFPRQTNRINCRIAYADHWRTRIGTRGPASGNWRDHCHPQADLGNTNRRSVINHTPKQRPSSGNRSAKKSVAEAVPEREHSEAKVQKPRKSSQEVRGDKDADIVVVNASVLVHALHQVKKWCRDGRDEIVIVPLEEGNESSHPTRAVSFTNFRGFIGTDACIHVQWDDAFVLWDRIEFKDMSADDAKDKAMLQSLHLSGSPEWVRHMMIMSLKLVLQRVTNS